MQASRTLGIKFREVQVLASAGWIHLLPLYVCPIAVEELIMLLPEAAGSLLDAQELILWHFGNQLGGWLAQNAG